MICRAYKTELDPTKEQRRVLSRHVAGARVAHNWALERWIALALSRAVAVGLRSLHGLDSKAGASAYAVGAVMRALSVGEWSGKGRLRKIRGVAIPGVTPEAQPSGFSMHGDLTKEKNQADSPWAWLRELSAFAVREGVSDVQDAYDHFFRRLREAKTPKERRKAGRPRFRRADKRSWHANQGSAINVTETHVDVPGVGWVRLKESGYLPTTITRGKLANGGHVCGIGLSEHGGRWYVALRVEEPKPRAQARGPGRALRDRPTPRIPGKVIGVDAGVRFLAVSSDGQRFPGCESDHAIQALERLRKRWERRMARRYAANKPRREQSQGWWEAKNEVAKYYRRVSELRDDRVGKAVRRIVDSGAEMIVIRGQSTAAMLDRDKASDAQTRNVLAPRIHGARMGELHERLRYKAEWAGARVVDTPSEYASSRRCSACGVVRESDPGHTFHCAQCGLVAEREDNSAANLAQWGKTLGPASADPEDGGRSGRQKTIERKPDGAEAGRTGQPGDVPVASAGPDESAQATPLGSGKGRLKAQREGLDPSPIATDHDNDPRDERRSAAQERTKQKRALAEARKSVNGDRSQQTHAPADLGSFLADPSGAIP